MTIQIVFLCFLTIFVQFPTTLSYSQWLSYSNFNRLHSINRQSLRMNCEVPIVRSKEESPAIIRAPLVYAAASIFAFLLFGKAPESMGIVSAINLKDSYEFTNAYFKYFIAGGCCASFSHAVTVPIDVVKIRLQTYPLKYNGVLNTGLKIAEEEGIGCLFTGIGPTVLGYSIHGSLKYVF